MKLPKLHKALAKSYEALAYRELSTSELMHIYITKDIVFASDGYIAITHKTSELFNASFIKNIPADGMQISGYDWKMLSKSHDKIEMDENLMITGFYMGRSYRKTLVQAFVSEFTPKDLISTVKPPKDRTLAEYSAVCSAKLLSLLYDVTGCEVLKLEVYKNNNMLHVTAQGGCLFPSVAVLVFNSHTREPYLKLN